MTKYIGENIRKYRTGFKLTREQLAEKSHIIASHLYQLEVGNNVPSIVTIIDITIAQLTDNLLYNSVNKFTEIIATDFNKLSENNKKVIIQIIKYMENN